MFAKGSRPRLVLCVIVPSTLLAAAAVAASCVGVSSAATGVIRTIPLSSSPDAVSSDGTDVWVANGESVSEIEASSGAVIRTIPVASPALSVSSDGTHVWVGQASAYPAGLVSEIEASSGAVIRTFPVGGSPGHSGSPATRPRAASRGPVVLSDSERV